MRRPAGYVGMAAIAVVVAVVIGGPAVAGGKGNVAAGACPKGKLCLWTGANYTDDRLTIKTRKVSNKIFTAPGLFNDAVSSLKLRKPGAAILYEDTDGQASYRCFRFEDRKVPDLADPAWQFDNIASSSRIPKNPDNSECNAP